MKMRFLVAAALAALSVGPALALPGYEQGRDYQALTKVIDEAKAPKVIEFFWFGCPHCYHISEPTEAWAQKLPQGLSFEMVPAVDGRWTNAGYLYYTAQKLGLNLNQKIFDAVHKDHNIKILFDPKAAQSFLVAQGKSADEVQKAWDSFEVKQKVTRAQKLFKDSGLEGVPTFIVNGHFTVPYDGDNQVFFGKLSSLPFALNVKPKKS